MWICLDVVYNTYSRTEGSISPDVHCSENTFMPRHMKKTKKAKDKMFIHRQSVTAALPETPAVSNKAKGL